MAKRKKRQTLIDKILHKKN